MKNILAMLLFSFLIGMIGCGSDMTSTSEDLAKPSQFLTSLECKDRKAKPFESQLGEQISCPKKFKLIGQLTDNLYGGVCCEYPLLTAKECEAELPNRTIRNPGMGLEASCDDFPDLFPSFKIGNISDFPEGGICCRPVLI